MIKASSSTEDGSTTSTRQRSPDSRTDSRTTMVNTSEFSPYLPQSPVSSQLKNVTFLSSSRNDHTCNASEQLTRVKCEARKQTISSSVENMTALSLDILRHTEILQSLLNSIEDNEILEIVSLLFLSLSLDTDEGQLSIYHRKRIITRLKVCPFILLSFIGACIDNKQERFKILLLLQKIALDLSNLWCRLY